MWEQSHIVCTCPVTLGGEAGSGVNTVTPSPSMCSQSTITLVVIGLDIEGILVSVVD